MWDARGTKNEENDRREVRKRGDRKRFTHWGQRLVHQFRPARLTSFYALRVRHAESLSEVSQGSYNALTSSRNSFGCSNSEAPALTTDAADMLANGEPPVKDACHFSALAVLAVAACTCV